MSKCQIYWDGNQWNYVGTQGGKEIVLCDSSFRKLKKRVKEKGLFWHDGLGEREYEAYVKNKLDRLNKISRSKKITKSYGRGTIDPSWWHK